MTRRSFDKAAGFLGHHLVQRHGGRVPSTPWNCTSRCRGFRPFYARFKLLAMAPFREVVVIALPAGLMFHVPVGGALALLALGPFLPTTALSGSTSFVALLRLGVASLDPWKPQLLAYAVAPVRVQKIGETPFATVAMASAPERLTTLCVEQSIAVGPTLDTLEIDHHLGVTRSLVGVVREGLRLVVAQHSTDVIVVLDERSLHEGLHEDMHSRATVRQARHPNFRVLDAVWKPRSLAGLVEPRGPGSSTVLGCELMHVHLQRAISRVKAELYHPALVPESCAVYRVECAPLCGSGSSTVRSQLRSQTNGVITAKGSAAIWTSVFSPDPHQPASQQGNMCAHEEFTGN